MKRQLVGERFGNYTLVRLLGRGGFAEVYLGHHVRLEMQVAVKVLHTYLTEEETLGFQREAQVIARLVHPNIVRLLDFDVKEGTPFLVMDYAPNGTLRQRHPGGTPLPLPTVISYITQIADALHYAHDQKLIHRDVKPENMLIGRRGEIVLSDFGVATTAHSTSSMSTQASVGTIPYMAPEQIQAHPRPASDQYALGIITYEWLTGERPFVGSYTEIFAKHLMTPPPPLRQKVPTLSAEVEQVVLAALAKEPRQRFGSIQAFATALTEASKVVSAPAGDGTEKTISSSPPPPTVIAPSSVEVSKEFTTPSEDFLPPTVLASPVGQAQTTSISSATQSESTTPAYSVPISSSGMVSQQQKAKIRNIGRREVVAMIIGTLLYACFIPVYFAIPIPYVYAAVMPALVIALFFGTEYGPWVGLIIAGVGYILSQYSPLMSHDTSYHGMFTSEYNFLLGTRLYHFGRNVGDGVMGFTAGLTLLACKKNNQFPRYLAVASFFGAISIIVGTVLTVYMQVPTDSYYQQSPWEVIGILMGQVIPNLLFSIVLLPILLLIYKRIATQKDKAFSSTES